jgi:hypothetical protein
VGSGRILKSALVGNAKRPFEIQFGKPCIKEIPLQRSQANPQRWYGEVRRANNFDLKLHTYCNQLAWCTEDGLFILAI